VVAVSAPAARRVAGASGLAEVLIVVDGVPTTTLAFEGGAQSRQRTARFRLPTDRAASFLDVVDPADGTSLLGALMDLEAHYAIEFRPLAIEGLAVVGSFSAAAPLGARPYVHFLFGGRPSGGVFAERVSAAPGDITPGNLPSGNLWRFSWTVPALVPFGTTVDVVARVAGSARLSSPCQLSAPVLGHVGYVEVAEGDRISGWAVDLAAPRRRVALDLVSDGRVIETRPANGKRADVQQLGIGDGQCGFSFQVPAPARGGAAKEYEVVLSGTAVHLHNSPVRVRAAPRILGFFDGMQGQVAVGWAIDADDPTTPVQIEVVRDGVTLFTDQATHFRGDVLAAGLPNAKCGFRIDLAEHFRDSIGREVVARVKGTDLHLAGSPKTVTENPNLRRLLDRETRLTDATRARLKRRLNHRVRGRALSIVMPVHNTDRQMLIEALESVRRQWCDNWELVCINDASTEPHVAEILRSYARHDRRYRVLDTPANVGIARATNYGLRAARFDYVTFMDHDDFLEPDAVYRLLRAIAETGADFLYSDELLTHDDIDSIMEVRARPAFSLDYYLSHPYFVHMLCVRKDLAQAVNGWDESMAISADIDFVLRVLEASRTVAHVPGVLYRWRTHSASTGHAKQSQVMAATREAIQRHLDRRGTGARVSDGPGFNQFRVDWPPDDGRVLIVIPTKNKGDLLKTCIDSIERTAQPDDYRIVVIDHQSTDSRTRRYLERIGRKHVVMPYKGPFNYARINNRAVRKHAGDARYLLFLNNDIEALEPGWLERMRSLAHRQDVGAVGALLLYGDRRVQHAGVILGFNNAADHAMKFQECFIEGGTRRNLGYNCTLSSLREFSAVTAACMMMRRDVFDRLGGFDESFVIGFNDTDLCLRAGALGLKVLYDGYTMLLHHESATRSETSQVMHPQDDRRLRKRWSRFFTEGDPFYNPLLDHMSSDHALRDDKACSRPAPPRITNIALLPQAAARNGAKRPRSLPRPRRALTAS